MIGIVASRPKPTVVKWWVFSRMLFKENIDNFSEDGVGKTISVKSARATHPVLKHVISHFFSSTVTGADAVLSFDAHLHDGTWVDSGMAPVNIKGSGSGTLSGITNSGIVSSIRPRVRGMNSGKCQVRTRVIHI